MTEPTLHQYLEHWRCSGGSLKECSRFDIWLWIENAPPIMMSPSLDKSGDSGLPIIRHGVASSFNAKALREIANKNIIKAKSLMLENSSQIFFFSLNDASAAMCCFIPLW